MNESNKETFTDKYFPRDWPDRCIGNVVVNEETPATDTMKVCSIIHGRGVSVIGHITDGILHTLSLKCSADLLAPKILKMKPTITKVLHEFVLNGECLDLFQSEANLIRSLDIYYCSNV